MVIQSHVQLQYRVVIQSHVQVTLFLQQVLTHAH